MKILKSNFEKTKIGLSVETDLLQIFFGNKNSSLDSIQKHFPGLHLQRIKQTHSDITVQASEKIVEADGHFTSHFQKALIISTADCMPILIFCAQTKRVAAVHAGWKGVANQIVLKTLKQLISSGSSQKSFEFWIGPHILQSSFEVDLDVLKQLESAAYHLKTDEIAFAKNNKFYVDLNKIVYSQIEEFADSNSVIHLFDFDTKTNLNFWSFRRDKEKAGRNLSFIALK